jgi:aspartate/methionine/tyrosine aminotransferase
LLQEKDTWDVDFELLEKSLNNKTKIVLINTPHNPTGKVFTVEEMERIHDLIKKYPNIIIVEDGVYEHLCF